ncbi:MAG TPA: hypothetical protein VIL65_01695 [Beijerinckiaceae bacterium]|jgi:hypothetical protein
MKLAGLTLLAAIAATPALAQDYVLVDPYGRVVEAPRGYGSPRGYAAAPLCRPWCPADQSPCDPPNFKIADGRCYSGNRRH